MVAFDWFMWAAFFIEYCVRLYLAPDLDCDDIWYENFRVVKHPDPHGFDADADGVGCET